MATIEKALQIAAVAHAGQLDRQDQPYILHPIRVMAGVEGLEAKMAAVLHDVVEDTAVTLEDLAREGFSEAVVEAVRCVTHEDGTTYADYVVRCKANPIALQVKLSDLADNTRLDRTIARPQALDRDMKRIARYLMSYSYLTGTLSEEQYRAVMVGLEKKPVAPH